jgi:hypothetical protein
MAQGVEHLPGKPEVLDSICITSIPPPKINNLMTGISALFDIESPCTGKRAHKWPTFMEIMNVNEVCVHKE